MINKIKQRLNKIYYNFNEFFYYQSSLEDDYHYNISKLSTNGLLFQEYEEKLIENNIDISCNKISWHYVLFYLLIRKNDYKNFLEIGTFDAKFTHNLSKYFNGSIVTIDLKSDSKEFLESYNRKSKEDFIGKRNQLLKSDKIIFEELDSFYLLDEYFNKQSFDLIWVDGDHKNPQVTFDIISSLKLLSKNGKLLIDDVVPKSLNFAYTSNESYVTLMNLEKRGIIKLELYLKRIAKSNSYNKKYIAVVSKL